MGRRRRVPKKNTNQVEPAEPCEGAVEQPGPGNESEDEQQAPAADPSQGMIREVTVVLFLLSIGEAQKCNKEYYFYNYDSLIQMCQPCRDVSGPCDTTTGDCLSGHSLRDERCLQVCPKYVLDVKFPRCVNSSIRSMETATRASPYSVSNGNPWFSGGSFSLGCLGGFLTCFALEIIVLVMCRVCCNEAFQRTVVDKLKSAQRETTGRQPDYLSSIQPNDEIDADPERGAIKMQMQPLMRSQPQTPPQEILNFRAQVSQLERELNDSKNENQQLVGKLSSVETTLEKAVSKNNENKGRIRYLQEQLQEERKEKSRQAELLTELQAELDQWKTCTSSGGTHVGVGVPETEGCHDQSLEQPASNLKGQEASMTEPPLLPPLSCEPSGADSSTETPLKQTAGRQLSS